MATPNFCCTCGPTDSDLDRMMQCPPCREKRRARNARAARTIRDRNLNVPGTYGAATYRALGGDTAAARADR